MKDQHIKDVEIVRYYAGLMIPGSMEKKKFREHIKGCYECASRVIDMENDFPEILEPVDTRQYWLGHCIDDDMMEKLMTGSFSDYEASPLITHLSHCSKCLEKYISIKSKNNL